MFRLRIGYVIAGIATGFILLFSFIWTLPDGKLHIVFCNVGQGDGAYVRFPDGRDMVVDGGPDSHILDCLGKHMPFWDRTIDMVVMTHPQKDHMQGLIDIFERYQVHYFVRSDVDNDTEGYRRLQEVVSRKKIPVRFEAAGQQVRVDATTLSFLWPSGEQIAKGDRKRLNLATQGSTFTNSQVLGATVGDLNDYCLVFHLRYGTFDALFTGDADMHVEGHYVGSSLADDLVEVLKVPHHGSRTGMTEGFVQWVHPMLAVISVGKNHYGHPSREALTMLANIRARVLRTDEAGDIEVISDGIHWQVKK